MFWWFEGVQKLNIKQKTKKNTIAYSQIVSLKGDLIRNNQTRLVFGIFFMIKIVPLHVFYCIESLLPHITTTILQSNSFSYLL